MADVVISGFPLSTFVRTARMACHHKGVDYDLEPHMPHSDEINALHPWGKVPGFQHGDVKLFESVAIALYVDEAFDGPALQPADAVGRARMHQWISAYNDNIYRPAGTIVIQRLMYEAQGQEPDMAAIEDSIPKARKGFEVLDGALANREWLAGNAVSVADMLVAPMVFYIPMLPEHEPLIGGLANLDAWYQRVAALDSFKQSEPPLEG